MRNLLLLWFVVYHYEFFIWLKYHKKRCPLYRFCGTMGGTQWYEQKWGGGMEQPNEVGASFGQWMKLRRNVLRLTQDELARLALCSNELIRKIESDTRRPSLETAERLADHLAIAEDVRTNFVKAARGERSVIHLPSPTTIGDGFNRIYVPVHAPVPSPCATPLCDPNRQRLLHKVKAFWVDGVLASSLDDRALIPLELVKDANRVAYPWDGVLQRPHQSPQALAPDLSILATFEQLDGQLLILGAPGAGKTTLLLTLAAALLERAQLGEDQPMPVVFHLASWAERALPLTEWLADELEKRYDSPRPIAIKWIEREQILLLLDGLDEVAQEKRSACIEAINGFRQTYRLTKLAVCSRLTDYEALCTQLQLAGALCLQPLTHQQIDSYLAHGGAPLNSLRELLERDVSLRKMAQSPLVLNLLLVSHRALEAETTDLKLSAQQWRTRLLAAYVDRMFQRRGLDSRYAQSQTTHWLAWLAQALSRQTLTIFHIEELQPDWLEHRTQRWLYVGAVSLITGLLIGASWTISWLLVTGYLFDLPGGNLIALVRGAVNGVAAGALVGWALGRHHAPPVEVAHGWTLAWPTLGMGALLGGLAGLAGGLVLAPMVGWRVACALSLSAGLAIGIASGIAFGLIHNLAQIEAVETMRWSWSSAVRKPVAKCTFALSAGLLIGAMLGTANGLGWGALLGWSYGWASGGAGAVALASILMLMDGLKPGEIATKVTPNQGIARSARNALRITLGVGLASGLVVGLIYALIFGMVEYTYGLQGGLLAGLLTGASHGIGTGLFCGLVYGGFAWIQHWVLRTILWASGAMPWNYTRFLDFAAERIFLHKVGGGYIFMHRLLQDYFGTRHL